MSLLRRRMMMQLRQEVPLFDIETVRISSDSWRGLKYTISNGELAMTQGTYSWTAAYVYLDNCVIGKKYMLTFYVKSERSSYPTNLLENGDTTLQNRASSTGKYSFSFTCAQQSPLLYLYWSTSSNETIPITYYDFILEEI